MFSAEAASTHKHDTGPAGGRGGKGGGGAGFIGGGGKGGGSGGGGNGKRAADGSSSAASGAHTYELYAVLVHEGASVHSGHYYCYVRPSNGVWYQLDDDVVRQCSAQLISRQQFPSDLLTSHCRGLNIRFTIN